MSEKVIVFDFDGVLVDTWNISYGISRAIIGKLSEDEYREFFMGNVYEYVKDKPHIDVELFFRIQKLLFEDLTINEETKKILETLKMPLHIISSNQEEAIRDLLTKSKSSRLFKEIMGRETQSSKQQKFEMLLKKYDLRPKQVIYVTDTVGDVMEARACKIKSIAVTFGYHDKERLSQVQPEAIITHITQLPKAIQEL